METQRVIIGNVLRSDIRVFVVASRLKEPEVPTFGSFVRVEIQQGQAELIGLIYDIRLQDDPFLRNLAATLTPETPRYQEIIRDQQENRAVPVEIAVAAVGYRDANGYHYSLPPQPPMVLFRIVACTADEVRQITARPDFMRVLLENRDIPADELIPAVLRTATQLRPAAEREAYLLDAGRYLARLIGRAPIRLESLLRRL